MAIELKDYIIDGSRHTFFDIGAANTDRLRFQINESNRLTCAITLNGTLYDLYNQVNTGKIESLELKNKIGHRGKAVKLLVDFLNAL